MWALFNYIHEIQMTKEQALACSHPGDCEADVKELLKHPKIKRQLKKISDEKLRQELKDYGAWDEEQLQSREDNEERIIWIAACNIAEEIRTKRTYRISI